MARLPHLSLIFIAAMFDAAAAGAEIAEHDSAIQLLRWGNALEVSKPLAVKFQVWQINTVFNTKKHGGGTYFRDGERTALRIGPVQEYDAVSALDALRPNRLHHKPFEKTVTLHSVDSLTLGGGDPLRFQTISLQPPASALRPENTRNPWEQLFRSQKPFFLQSILRNLPDSRWKHRMVPLDSRVRRQSFANTCRRSICD